MAATLISAGMDEVRQHRAWFFVWGIVLIVLGFIAVASSVLTTLISVLLLGWILIFSGAFDVIHGLTRRRYSHLAHRDAPLGGGSLSPRHRVLTAL